MTLGKFLLLFICVLANSTAFLANEFFYPVIHIKNEVFCVHQKTIEDLILLKCNNDKNTVENNLIPNCLPGDLTLLPNKNGFSFIDQGKIRINFFNSEKIITINLSEPVYNICKVNWIDNQTCYFSAKSNLRFCIFFANILSSNVLSQSQLFSISQKSVDEKIGSDFLYPQKIDSSLFFIERSMDERYRTKKSHYKIVKMKCPDYTQASSKILTEADKEILLDFGNIPISFLNMISLNVGFFIEHQALIEKTDKLITLDFHRFEFNEITKFNHEKLFSFSLPIKYIFGKSDERLYESISPFLPKIYENKIYYTHCSDEEKLNCDIYSYDLKNNKTEKETFALPDELYFSPILVDDKIFYGSNINQQNPKNFRLHKNELKYFLKK